MKRKSKKVIEAEEWVDHYIEKHGQPPGYYDLAYELGISKSAAYQRCKKFRSKMDTHITTKPKVMNATRVKLEFIVPADKFDLFTNMLQQIKNILKP